MGLYWYTVGLQDNYAWLLLEQSGKVAVVDPSEAAPVMAALESRCCPPPSPALLWTEVQATGETNVRHDFTSACCLVYVFSFLFSFVC